MAKIVLGPDVVPVGVSVVEEQSGAEGVDEATGIREAGEWGDVISVEDDVHPVPVLGLLAPDATDAKSSAGFTLGASGGAGLKLNVGIASFGVSMSYAIVDHLEIPGTSGKATVGSLLIPIEVTTQLLRPDGAGEWFPVKRYRLQRLDPARPFLGGRTDYVEAADLLDRRNSTAIQIGGGNAPTAKKYSQKLDIKAEASLNIPLKHDQEGKSTDNAVLSANFSGSVAAETSCEIPANLIYNMFWLEWMAGACFVKDETGR